MTFSYAGIGSRETPDDVLNSMRSLAWELAKDGWHVRSGGADGADAAFHLGVLGIGKLVESYPMTIYIAWDGMNGHRHGDMKGSVVIPNAEFQQTLFEMAELYHPAWYRVGKKGRLLHARNGSIVLGEAALDPVQAVICWTKGGRVRGRNCTGYEDR